MKWLMLAKPLKNLGSAVAGRSKSEALSDLGPNVRSSISSLSEDGAKKIAAVFSCIELIAGALSRLDWLIPEDLGIQRLMNKTPCQALSGSDLRQWIMEMVLLRGNCILVIQRDSRTFRPIGLLPIPDGYWQVKVIDSGPLIGRLRYDFRGLKVAGAPLSLDQDDVLHFHWSFFDVRTGIGARPLQTGLSSAAALEAAMTEYSGDFFDRGMQSDFAVVRQGAWNEDQRKDFQNQWAERYQGRTSRGVPMVFGEGTKLEKLTLNAEDMQMIESREFQIDDIARVFRVPSFLLNREAKTSSWGSGISQVNNSFLHFTLGPWVKHLESEVSRKFFPTADTVARLDTTVLTRGTMLERYQAYAASIGAGWDTVNEVRKMEGRDPFGPEFDTPTANVSTDMSVLQRMIERETAGAPA